MREDVVRAGPSPCAGASRRRSRYDDRAAVVRVRRALESPPSARRATTRESIVGLRSSSRASSDIPIGPHRTTVKSTDASVWVRPVRGLEVRSRRQRRAVARRSRAAVSVSVWAELCVSARR